MTVPADEQQHCEPLEALGDHVAGTGENSCRRHLGPHGVRVERAHVSGPHASEATAAAAAAGRRGEQRQRLGARLVYGPLTRVADDRVLRLDHAVGAQSIGATRRREAEQQGDDVRRRRHRGGLAMSEKKQGSCQPTPPAG